MLCGCLPLASTKADAISEDGGINGGINQLFLHIRNNPGKRTVDIAKSLNISEDYRKMDTETEGGGQDKVQRQQKDRWLSFGERG
jgi:hypothetical protein